MGDEEVVREFGRMVRRLRLEQGYSQEGFAFRVGLHRTYVGSIERGEKAVTIATDNKRARAPGTNLAGMFAELEPDDLDRR